MLLGVITSRYFVTGQKKWLLNAKHSDFGSRHSCEMLPSRRLSSEKKLAMHHAELSVPVRFLSHGTRLDPAYLPIQFICLLLKKVIYPKSAVQLKREAKTICPLP